MIEKLDMSMYPVMPFAKQQDDWRSPQNGVVRDAGKVKVPGSGRGIHSFVESP